MTSWIFLRLVRSFEDEYLSGGSPYNNDIKLGKKGHKLKLKMSNGH